MLKRHKVRLRRNYVRYRFRSTMTSLGKLTARLLFVALGFAGAHQANRWWAESPRLRLREVRVEEGAPPALKDRSGLAPGRHLFGFSTAAAAERLLGEFPELAEVRVKRRWNGDVTISARKRVPAARLALGEGWLALDESGAAFPWTADPSLTIIAGVPSGPAAAPALKFLKSLEDLDAAWAKRVVKLQWVPGGEAVLHLDQGPPVYWGFVSEADDQRRAKAARLQRVLEDSILKDGAVYVRFVTQDRLAVKLKTTGPSGV